MKHIRFYKVRPTDLSSNQEVMCESLRFGKYDFTMTDFMAVIGHDDSLPYQATLLVNGEPICNCSNDGWGGTTNLYPIGDGKLFEECKKAVQEYKWCMNDKYTMPFELDFVADILAETCNCKKKFSEK